MRNFDFLSVFRFPVLVATDVAARGIDIPELDLIVLTRPPERPELYVHRAGRTGRAGRHGTVITFFTRKELGSIHALQRRIGVKIKIIGTPQLTELIAVGAEEALEKVVSVEKSMVAQFEAAARDAVHAAMRGKLRPKVVSKTAAAAAVEDKRNSKRNNNNDDDDDDDDNDDDDNGDDEQEASSDADAGALPADEASAATRLLVRDEIVALEREEENNFDLTTKIIINFNTTGWRYGADCRHVEEDAHALAAVGGD